MSEQHIDACRQHAEAVNHCLEESTCGGLRAYDPELVQNIAKVFDIIESRRQTYRGREDKPWVAREAFMRKALALAQNGDEITFAFPGFPCKSPICETKVLGDCPDRAERMSVENLRGMMDEINAVLPSGARLMIISDGLPFASIFNVPDQVVHNYLNELRGLTRDSNIEFLSMVEMVRERDTIEDKRELILDTYGPSEIELDVMIKTDPEFNAYYTGLKFFLSGDMEPHWEREYGTLTRSQRNKLIAPITREYMRMNVGFNRLVEEQLPEVIRLSCHPQYETNTEKVGIELIFPSQKYSWATPWHGAMVQFPDGSWDITRKSIGLERGCEIVCDVNGRPDYLLAPGQ